MDADQHGSQDDLHRPSLRIRPLRVAQLTVAIEASRGPASVRAGVHGSPCGFRLSVNVQQYATSARHAEGVNSSAEPRNVHRLSSSHAAAPSPRDRPQGSNRRPYPAVES
jgi:hypothetical protein